MAGETTITLIGNLTRDPELRFTPSGAAVTDFTVASTARTFDRQTNEWKDGDTLFIRCSAWRQLAENVAGSLAKGQRVIVTGALKVRQYDKDDGSKGTSVEMTVDEVGPSLRNATAVVTRATSQGGGQPQQAPAQQASAWATPPAQQPQQPPASAWGGQPAAPPPAAAQQPAPQQTAPDLWGQTQPGAEAPPF